MSKPISSLNKEWIKANALDPLHWDNAIIDVWLDTAVDIMLDMIENKVIDIQDLIDSTVLPSDYAEKFALTFGSAYSATTAVPYIRESLRRSMSVWKRRGSLQSYRILFSMFRWYIEIGQVNLDRHHYFSDDVTGCDLFQWKDEDDKYVSWDEAYEQGITWDDPSYSWDNHDGKFWCYDIPAEYEQEFIDSGSWYGRTSFYVINVWTDTMMSNANMERLIDIHKVDVEPLHCRLLYVNLWALMSSALTGQYGSWSYGYDYGYGYSYGYDPVHGYGLWYFEPEGDIGGINDTFQMVVVEVP